MVFELNKKKLEKLYENNEFDKIFKIYEKCTSKEDLEKLRLFLNRKNDNLTEKQKEDLFINIVMREIRKHNIKDQLDNFTPFEIKNKKNTDILTSEESVFLKTIKKQFGSVRFNYKDRISEETYINLRQIYNTNKDSEYTGIYNVNTMMIDNYFEQGIYVGRTATIDKNIKIMNNFDYMLNTISDMEDLTYTEGCLLVKIPKHALKSKAEPIYYEKEKYYYLNPKYIICYIPVVDRKILPIEYNDEAYEIESTVYDGEKIEKKINKR